MRVRPGPQGKARDIKSHPWFQGFDWEALAARRMDPPRKPKESDAAKRKTELAEAHKAEPREPPAVTPQASGGGAAAGRARVCLARGRDGTVLQRRTSGGARAKGKPAHCGAEGGHSGLVRPAFPAAGDGRVGARVQGLLNKGLLVGSSTTYERAVDRLRRPCRGLPRDVAGTTEVLPSGSWRTSWTLLGQRTNAERRICSSAGLCEDSLRACARLVRTMLKRRATNALWTTRTSLMRPG